MRGAKIAQMWLLLYLPGCSLLFQAPADVIDASGVDGGLLEPDGPLGNVDAALDSTTPDAALCDATVPDAMVLPPDAALCDPFTEAGCYVQNNPLGGPSFEPIGTGDINSDCTESSDCAPFMFCTGVGGTVGDCLQLCDAISHLCPDITAGLGVPGKCLSTDWQSFGFCEKQF